MIISTAEVEDFDRYWEVFTTRGTPKRKEHGSRSAQVFRDADNPNKIHILFDWDREDFEKFLKDPEMPEIFKEAGMKGPPQPTFVEVVDKLEA